MFKEQYFNKNKERRKKQVSERKRHLRDEVNKLKIECSMCDEDENICLDFHHINDDKVDSVACMISDGRELSAIIEEAKKCIVVCKNCHAKIHWKD